MRRRELIGLFGSAVAWPLAAHAQATPRRIGFVSSFVERDQLSQSRVEALRDGLRALGWQEGKNLNVEYRWSGTDTELLRRHTSEIVNLAPEIIVTGSTVAAQLLRATAIPVVFVGIADPVGSGIVPSLARPGKNITGFTAFEPEITGKWLALLKELAPNVKRAALIFHPESPFGESFWRAFQVAAPSAGITAVRMAVRDAAEIERNIAQFSQGGDGGLLGVPEVIISMHRGLIFRLAAQHRLPAIYPYRFHAAEGGLASYGIDTGDMWRRSASYVDRILKGEKPADLPVQAPTKFEYVINLRTARALGLDIPPALQTRADEVIE